MQINQNTYIDDCEPSLNICNKIKKGDIDLLILHWSKLISSSLKFFLEILTFKPFFILSKI